MSRVPRPLDQCDRDLPQRGASPWHYLADVIRQRRKGLPAPPLPQPQGVSFSSAMIEPEKSN